MDFLLKLSRQTQALAPGETFKVPPLDGSLTVPQIYDWHYEHNPQHTLFTYEDPNDPGKLVKHTYSEVVPAIHRAGRYVAAAAGLDINADPHTYPVVAIIALSDTITFHTTVVGMMRAGIPVFTITPRFSACIVAHLLRETSTTHILASSDAKIQALVDEAVKLVPRAIGVIRMPTFGDLYFEEKGGRGFEEERIPERVVDCDATTIIVHSSGSTSLPKPIRWNARRDLQTMICPAFGDHDFCGQIWGCHAIELFHGLGLSFVFWPISTGMIMATFPPAEPAITPSSKRLFSGFVATKPNYVLIAPQYIQEWAGDSEKLEFLRTLKGLSYAGSHLNKAVGDYLANEGVQILTVFGSSEGGCIGHVFPNNIEKDWEYIGINPHSAAEFVPQGDGTFEMILLGKPITELSIKNAKYQGYDAYATRDLFIPHPTKAGLWRILGRADDQIMLSTGEVTNPNALEDILCQHPRIAAAVMFGRNRPKIGVILEPSKECQVDTSDPVKLEAFKNEIWGKVEEMNKIAPPHSRISAKMILVASPLKPFQYTTKGIPRRPIILQQYQEEIDYAYR
ncbi:hypothetical protein AX16_007810 [Volvariella volvacea WC 439]|nr:hypothetical protein AX16_007810 [Volvariella volvacea WC 439]